MQILMISSRVSTVGRNQKGKGHWNKKQTKNKPIFLHQHISKHDSRNDDLYISVLYCKYIYILYPINFRSLTLHAAWSLKVLYIATSIPFISPCQLRGRFTIYDIGFSRMISWEEKRMATLCASSTSTHKAVGQLLAPKKQGANNKGQTTGSNNEVATE